MTTEKEILTLEDWLNESYQGDKGGLPHRNWILKCNAEKKKRAEDLQNHLGLSSATIYRFQTEVQLPKSDVRQAISDFIGQPILWKTGNKFIVTFNYEPQNN